MLSIKSLKGKPSHNVMFIKIPLKERCWWYHTPPALYSSTDYRNILVSLYTECMQPTCIKAKNMQIKTTLSFSDCTLPVIYGSDRNAGSDAVHQTQSFSCTHTNIAWINNKSYYICSWINHHTIHRNTLMHTNVNRLEAPLKSENGEGVSRDVAFSASISLFPFLAKKIQLNRVLTKPNQWHNYNLFCFLLKYSGAWEFLYFSINMS